MYTVFLVFFPHPPLPTKALQEVNVKMIDLKMHECWKVKKPTGKQQPGGALPVRTMLKMEAVDPIDCIYLLC